MRRIKRFLRKLFGFISPELPPNCKTCKHRKGWKKDNTWYCSMKYDRVKKNIGYYKPICGKPRVKTSPKWCPLKNK